MNSAYLIRKHFQYHSTIVAWRAKKQAPPREVTGNNELCKHRTHWSRSLVFEAGAGTGGKRGLSGRFNTIMEKAGVEGKRTQASGGRTLSSLSFHCFRYSFNSALANAGLPQEIRQKLSGHGSTEMNAI